MEAKDLRQARVEAAARMGAAKDQVTPKMKLPSSVTKQRTPLSRTPAPAAAAIAYDHEDVKAEDHANGGDNEEPEIVTDGAPGALPFRVKNWEDATAVEQLRQQDGRDTSAQAGAAEHHDRPKFQVGQEVYHTARNMKVKITRIIEQHDGSYIYQVSVNRRLVNYAESQLSAEGGKIVHLKEIAPRAADIKVRDIVYEDEFQEKVVDAMAEPNMVPGDEDFPFWLMKTNPIADRSIRFIASLLYTTAFGVILFPKDQVPTKSQLESARERGEPQPRRDYGNGVVLSIATAMGSVGRGVCVDGGAPFLYIDVTGLKEKFEDFVEVMQFVLNFEVSLQRGLMQIKEMENPKCMSPVWYHPSTRLIVVATIAGEWTASLFNPTEVELLARWVELREPEMPTAKPKSRPLLRR